MKRLLAPGLFAALTALGLLLSGCGGGGGKLDTAEVTEAFATADAALKAPAGEAVKLLQAGKLLEGATTLVKVAKDGGEKLTEPQKNALINLSASIQMAAAGAQDSDAKLEQTIEDLMAALEGRESGKVGVVPAPAAAK